MTEFLDMFVLLLFLSLIFIFYIIFIVYLIFGLIVYCFYDEFIKSNKIYNKFKNQE